MSFKCKQAGSGSSVGFAIVSDVLPCSLRASLRKAYPYTMTLASTVAKWLILIQEHPFFIKSCGDPPGLDQVCSMPSHSSEIWRRLPPTVQRQIHNELSTILQEVLYEQIRAGDPSAPGAQGAHLHSTVDSASGALQPGEPTSPVRLAATRS